MNIPRNGFYEKELEITISCSYGPGRYDYDYEQKGIDYPIGYVRWTENRNMEAIIQLLHQKKLDFSKLITHKIPIDEALKAYDLITNKTNEPYLGILIEYSKEIKTSFTRTKGIAKTTIQRNKINLGFIGAGNFAQSYLLPNLKKNNVNLINVSTRTPINAKSVAEKFGFNNYSSSPEEILNDNSIDTVFIATHHSSHAHYVLEALKARKNIFVEKPLAINDIQLDEIVSEYNKVENNKILVGFNRRFSKPFLSIKEFFNKSSSPFIINYRVNAGFIPNSSWIQNPNEGGRIIGEGCHFIDIFDFIINSKPISVYASSIRDNNVEMKNEDNTVVTITYENGSVANLIYLANGDKSVQKEYCEVFSSGKTAIMNDFKEVSLFSNGTKKKMKFDGGKGHKEEVNYFIELLLGKTEEKLNFDSITNTTKITFKVLESLKNNRVVKL